MHALWLTGCANSASTEVLERERSDTNSREVLERSDTKSREVLERSNTTLGLVLEQVF